MLDGVLIGLAVLCVVYFIIIVVYAGISTSFAFIWLFFAALLVFLVYGKWYYARNMERIPMVPVSVVTTCIAGVAVLGILCILVFLGAATPGKANLDYVDCAWGPGSRKHTVSNSLKKASGQGHCFYAGGESVHHSGGFPAARGRGKQTARPRSCMIIWCTTGSVPGSCLWSPIPPARWRTLLTARLS